jgi:hypothetical protein
MRQAREHWKFGGSQYGGYSCLLLLKFMLRVPYLDSIPIHLTVIEEAKRSKSLLIERVLTATMNELMRVNLSHTERLACRCWSYHACVSLSKKTASPQTK